MQIDIGRQTHYTSSTFRARRAGRPLTGAEAATVAGWWGDPGRGLALAELASSGRTDSHQLLAATVDAMGYADNAADREDLCLLYAWALSQCNPRRATGT